MVIELFVKGTESFFDVRKIHHPSGLFPWATLHMYFQPERMTVQSPTLVVGRNIRQVMSRFYREYLKEFQGPLPDPNQFMSLQTESPLWVREAVLYRKSYVLIELRPVHWLEKIMFEIELFKL